MKVEVVPGAEAPAVGSLGGAASVSGLRSARALAPDGYSLSLVEAELEAGAELRWPGRHGDEAVYVLDGSLDVDGHTCPPGGAVVVEGDADVVARAVVACRVLAFSPRRPHPPASAGPPGAHVLGPGGWFRSGEAEGTDARWFADSTCPSCRIALLRVRRDGPDHRGRAHTHSQDEIIYVEAGELHMGALHAGPGDAVAIPADVRYALRSGPAGLTFLNYRADRSEQVYDRSLPPLPEGGLARGGELVGDFR